MSAAMGQVAPVSRHSDEFTRIEHLLQLSCRSTAAREISVWSISNPHLTVAFERKAQALLSLDCWVNINDLDAANAVQDVCKRGFQPPVSGEGLPFTTGNIKFSLDGPESHQYLLCTVAVGRSFVQDDVHAKRELPAGYDSLYLHTGDTSAIEGVPATNVGDAYRHTYVVFESAQVLPRYVVHFAYSPKERLQRQLVKPINLAEIKAKVAETLALLGPAAPAATEKMLSDIGDAYESALQSSQSGDALLEDRRQSIQHSLKSIDDKLQAVQANSAQVEEALYQKMQEALFQLQESTQRKMNVLLSEELELRRQLQQIEWSESFIRVMQDTLPPMSFISAWDRHAALRTHLYAQLSAGLAGGALDEVQADLKLVGHIEVMSERAVAAANDVRSVAAGKHASTAIVPVPANNFAASASDSFAASKFDNSSFSTPSTSNIWNAVLRESMGLAPTEAAASNERTLALASPAITTIEQAQASLALAKANLAAIEGSLESLPPGARGQAEMARAERMKNVAEAESLYASMVREEAQAYLAQRDTSTPAPATRSAGFGGRTATSTVHETALVPAASATATVSTIGKQISTEDKRARHSIKKEAERQRRQRGFEDLSLDELAFPMSQILQSRADAESLYMCLPFGLGDDGAGRVTAIPPAARLIWASYDATSHTVESLMNAYLSHGRNEPTVMLIRASGSVFGGYAADPWDFSDLFTGSARSFLFSVTSDVKIPYTGRQKGPKQPGDELLRQQLEFAYQQDVERYNQMEEHMSALHGGTPEYDDLGRLIAVEVDEFGNQTQFSVAKPKPRPFVRCDATKSSMSSIQFGVKDLVITHNLTNCTSEVEWSYGIGLKPGSIETKTLLAGSATFTPDAIELWAISAESDIGEYGFAPGGSQEQYDAEGRPTGYP